MVSTGWNFRPQDRTAGSAPDGLRSIGFQYTEFALPVRAADDLAIWTLMPWRPPVVEPLAALAPDGRCVLLGPLDTFFDQVITVPVPNELDRGITWGWHGDLLGVTEGFASRLAVVGGHGMRDTLARYTALVAAVRPTPRLRVDADSLGRSLSYWTDNGAAYWYRTEGDRDTPATLVDTVTDLRARDIPIAAVQLDSWFYPHEVLRPFDTDDWVVPPTGLIEWEPRPDVLPDGVATLAAALGDPPLATHCRHLSSASPLLERFACYVDADRAHPVGSDLYEHWLDRAVSWGVETFEHDWLIECYLGVRGLRERAGRAEDWQAGIDRAAANRDMTLQWCMASPADLLHASTLERVTSIRTSGDHGYLVGPGFLWNWFLLVNALARGLGLHPFKDVFWSDRHDPDRHSEIEALLSALSTGPVGLGDRLGGADRELVLRTCLADGTIVRPDVPIAAIDACFERDAVSTPVALTGECWSDHPAGRWSYVVAIHAADNLAPDGSGATPAIEATIRTNDLGELRTRRALRRLGLAARHGRSARGRRRLVGAAGASRLGPADPGAALERWSRGDRRSDALRHRRHRPHPRHRVRAAFAALRAARRRRGGAHRRMVRTHTDLRVSHRVARWHLADRHRRRRQPRRRHAQRRGPGRVATPTISSPSGCRPPGRGPDVRHRRGCRTTAPPRTVRPTGSSAGGGRAGVFRPRRR